MGGESKRGKVVKRSVPEGGCCIYPAGSRPGNTGSAVYSAGECPSFETRKQQFYLLLRKSNSFGLKLLPIDYTVM